MKFLVDAVIPTLNSSRLLELCLTNLRNQEFGELINIIVIDGGSTDETLKIAKDFNSNIYCKKGMYSNGKNGARNYGINLCKTEYYWQIDSDNILLGNKVLTKLMMPFEDDPKIIISNPLIIKENNRLTLNNYLSNIDNINFFTLINSGVKRDGYIFLEDLDYGLNNASIIKNRALKLVGYDQDIATLARLRAMHLSASAIVPDAQFIHLQTTGFIDYIKKLNKRVILSSKYVKLGKDNFFITLKNQELLGNISHTKGLSPIGSLVNLLKYQNIKGNKFIFLSVPLILSYLMITLRHPISAYNVYKYFV